MKFTPKQQEVITTRNKNILVSAAAGSGKTSVLVERILSMITDSEEPVDIDRFLIVTFTSAAASEMRERIHRAILKRLEENPADENLRKQSALIHNAQITTIDSFCLFLLRNHFHEIELDPAFRVGDPGEIKLIEKEVLADTLEEFYAEKESEFLYFADAYCPDGKDGKIEKLVEELYHFSMSHPWPKEWLYECRKKIEELDEANLMQTEWMQYGMELALEQAKSAGQKAQAAMRLCLRPDGPYMYEDNINSDIEIISGWEKQIASCMQNGTYEETAGLLKKPAWSRLSAKKDDSVSPELRDLVKAMRDRYKKMLSDIQSTFFAGESLAELTEKEKEAGRLERVLIRITMRFIDNLTETKRRKNVLDFSDIEHYALQILVRDGKPTKTAEMYREHYKAVMIDEYQDSNLVQELLLASVSTQEEGRCNRFMVGDMKQSIYRFRMARPEIFMEKFEAYRQGGQDNRLICLRRNFRSREEILHSTNAVFERLMRPQIGGVVYDEDAALYPGAEYPKASGCETELCLAAQNPLEGQDKRTAEAYLIAYKIKELMTEFKVEGRPLRYSDIVILLRSVNGTDECIKKVLMSEGIPSYVTSKTGYFTAMEVSRLMDLLRVMNNPYNDIAFCSVCISVFFGFDNEELSLITACAARGESLYERFLEIAQRDEATISGGLSRELVRKVRESLTLLGELRREAVVLSMTELVNYILKRFHYTEYVAALPAGEQRKANVEMFVQKTVDFEKTSYHGLFDFLRYMEQLQKYEVDFGEAATLEETADVVRIMSIHKSKGLEFPVCFVSGLDKQYNLRDTTATFLMDADWGVVANRVLPNKHTVGKTMRKNIFAGKMKRDSLGEELRVLYVAMTRAKEKLILTAVSEQENVEKWVKQTEAECKEEGVLSPELIENAKCALEHLLRAWSINKDAFSIEWVPEEVLQRKQIRDISGRMCREERVRMLSGLSGQEDKIDTEELLERFSYVYPHKELASLYTKTSVSELKHAAMEEEGVSVMFPTQEKETEYLPAFKRQQETICEGAARGSAMHRILELLDFEEYVQSAEKLADEENGEEWQQMCDRLDADIEHFTETGRLQQAYAGLIQKKKLIRFFRSDIAKRMADAQQRGELFKEEPFVLAVSAGLLDEKFPAEEKVLIQGIIDVYFVENGEITILDYKTDRVSSTEKLKDRYRTQLDYYESAVAQLTGKPVKEKILYSFALADTIAWK